MRALPMVAGLAALLLAGPALASGSKADYARAKAMPKLVKGKVLNARLRVTWHGEETLSYRRQTASGKRRRVTIDVSTGKEVERRPAAKSGDDVIEPSGVRRSRGGGGEDTEILFVNGASQPVDLIWLDHGGKPHKYVTVAAGEEHRQHTFPGHVWLVKGKDGREFGTWAGQPEPGVIRISDDMPEPTPETESKPHDDALSPDGRTRAFLRDHNVFVRDTKTKKERRLSADGSAKDPYVRRRLSWSPSGRYLAVIQEEPAQSRRVHVVEAAPKDAVQPKLHDYGYLKPGDKIARPRPRLFDVKKGKPIEIPEDLYATPWSISQLSWSEDGKRFRFLYNQRGHQVLRLVELDATRGTVRAVIEEQSETFVDYSQKTWLRAVPGTDDWFWMSERSGWNHLYRVDGKTGTVTEITKGAWVVRDVTHVDEDAKQIWFRAMGVFPNQDPYHVHHGRVGFDGKGLTWLTEGDGTHTLAFSPERTHYVDTWSRVDHAPVHELRRAKDGGLVAVLETADWKPLLQAGWRPPERFTAKGRDGATDIWGVIYRPTDFDDKAKYPVLEQIYAGPHGHHVPKSFRAWQGARALAELGFVVVQIDGMGTNWRSKAFHDVCCKNLGDSGFEDRIAWMRAAAATRPWMDLMRVGIYGGSAGGQRALRALLAHGDFYDAAVADCGCHDNRMDKIWWNEAWMGWPIGPHYAEQSNVTQAHRLEGKLLLIVGALDHNVDPSSTMQVVDALIKADKDFDLLVIPSAGHGAAGTPYGRRRLRDFFVRHLLGVEPRGE